MATSGSFETEKYSGIRGLRFIWSVTSQSVADNSTTITWMLLGSGSRQGTWYNTKNAYLNINGARVYTEDSQEYIRLDVGTLVASGTITIQHDSSGEKTFSADAGAMIYYYGSYLTGSGSWELPPINRYATITSAPDFTDEQNPTISYTNSAGESADSLMACISLDGSMDDVAYRNINKTGNSYTFSLTDAERNVLRNATTNANSRTVKFFIRTRIGQLEYHDYKDVTFTVVNANPTFSNVSYRDTNSTIVAITGNDQKIVQSLSTLRVTYGSATALKGASITGYTFNVNGVVRTSSAAGGTVDFGTVNSSMNVTLTATATDSRGNTTTVERTVTMLAYASPSALVTLVRLNNYEDTTYLTVDGTVASVESLNTMVIQYRYKQKNGTYGSYVTIPDNVQQTLSLSKNNEYVFNILVTDRFGGSFSQEYPLSKGRFPLYIDTGKNAVGINEFPQSGEALRVADGVAVFEDGIEIGTESVEDFVVEQGTSNGWTYRKWNSGILEQWITKTVTYTSWVSWGSWYSGVDSSGTSHPYPIITFGIPFLASTIPTVTATNSALTWSIPIIEGTTNTQFKISGIRPNAGTTVADAYEYGIYAVGRWK